MNKGATKDAKQTWIKTTTKKGYTVKLVNKTKKIVSLTGKKVVAKKAGTAKINVNFYKGKKYVATKSVKITVKKAPVASGIKLEKDTLNVGETTKVVHSGTAKVNCFSADTSIVKVNKTTGEVTAVAPGTTKIAVRNAVTKKRVYVDVTVNDKAVDAPVATQTGSNIITVTNGISMEGKEVTVTKGSTTVALAKVNGQVLTESGTKLTLTTASKLTDGEYTVKIGDKTATVKAQTEKVDKIVIDSDVAILKVDNDGKTNYNEAYAYYTVSNQFGEDITKKTTVSTQGAYVSTETATTTGKINFIYNANTATGSAIDTGFRLGDIVTAVVMYNENGTVVTSETKQLKISDKAVVNEIDVEGLYNEDGKELTEDTLQTDDFYILFNVKDQYGKTWDAATVGRDSSSQVIATLSAGVTDVDLVTSGSKYAVKTMKVKGTEYLALRLKEKDNPDDRENKSGTVVLTLIGSGSGKNETCTFEVKDGVKVKSLSISTDGQIIASNDESVKLNYTATGVNGEEITSYKVLKELNDTKYMRASSASAKIEFKENYETGKAELYYIPDTNMEQGYTEVITGMTQAYTPITYQFNVSAKAYPKAIVGGLDANGLLVECKNDSTYNHLDISNTSFTYQDQYGRAFDKIDSVMTDKDNNQYTIKLKDKTSATDVYNSAGTDNNTATDLSSAFRAEIQGEAGSKVYTAFIQRTDSAGKNPATVDQFDIEIYAVHDYRLKSYSLKDFNENMFYAGTEANPQYGKKLTVYGHASGNVKVLMPEYYYGIKTNDDKNMKVATGSAVYINGDLKATGGILEKTNSVDRNITVTITSGAAIGTELTKKVVISKDVPSVKHAITFDHTNNTQTTAIKTTTDTTLNYGDILKWIVVTDQYDVGTTGSAEGIVYATNPDGKGKDISETPKVTIYDIDSEDIKNGKISVVNNGTANIGVTIKKKTTVKVKITFANGFEYQTVITTNE